MLPSILAAVSILLIAVNLALIGQSVHRLKSHPNDELGKHEKYLMSRLYAMSANFAVAAGLWIALILI